MEPRGLLTAQALGQEPAGDVRAGRRNRIVGLTLAALAIVAAVMGVFLDGAAAAAFFGAGAAALLAAMFLLSAWLRLRPSGVIAGHGTGPVMRLGFRSAASRPKCAVRRGHRRGRIHHRLRRCISKRRR
jgi:hypothetical protein